LIIIILAAVITDWASEARDYSNVVLVVSVVTYNPLILNDVTTETTPKDLF